MPAALPRRRLVIAGVVVAAGVLGGGAVAAGAVTPGPSPSAQQRADPPAPTTTAEAAEPAAEDKAARQADKGVRRADKAARRADKGMRRAAPTGPAFVCDPALSHGQNVSAYARSLPEGPGRGRLVSQAARSDCGKPSAGD